ncbi:hypothetical protein J31TS4_26780 [Paenibacillus sp. J31TS4]|uniref:hypothetical protein n=1 Tax=Paenibacillus sp. J31TS4 TaxID=2807195 RepID=UPI001B16ACB0|nr:hypothetical protein [Paenibacillus sp. J31TS4]GIP39398.1 hypothetical protein J31TS4_26780 [Paenibacillus sp. J31TS4]
MHTPRFAPNHWISITLVFVLMLFVTPTPTSTPETSASESSARTSASQGSESAVQLIVRKQSSETDQKRMSRYFPAALALAGALLFNGYRRKLTPRVSFAPLIARRLSRLLLAPIRYTSTFV